MKLGYFVTALVWFGSAVAGANADLYLNGALSYDAIGPDGANQGGPAEYDSFPTDNSDLLLNGLNHTPIPLALGDNVITVEQGFQPNIGLVLFFSSDAAIFDGPQDRPGDLALFQLAAGGPFAYVSATTAVPTWGTYSAEVPYSGATSYAADGLTAAVTALDFSGGNGAITISVTPEPASAAMFGLIAIAIAALGRRR